MAFNPNPDYSLSIDPAYSNSQSYTFSTSSIRAAVFNYYHDPEAIRLATTLKDILLHLSYKPGWKFEVEESVGYGLRLVATMSVPDAQTGKPTVIGLAELLPTPPPDWDQDYALSLIKKLIQKMEEHEMKEWLRLDGECVDDPHPEVVKFPKPEAALRKMETMGVDKALDSYNHYNQMITTRLLNTVQVEMNRLIIDPLKGI